MPALFSSPASWTSHIPQDVLCNLIDNHITSRAELRSLSLTCTTLGLYCRRLIFQEVRLGNIKWDIEEEKSKNLKKTRTERFASLLKQSPEIANSVQYLLLVGTSYPERTLLRTLLPVLPAECKALMFILERHFPALKSVGFMNKQVVWPSILPNLQQLFLRFLKGHPCLETVGFSLGAFPPSILGGLRGRIGEVHICGDIRPESGSQELASYHECARVDQLVICHVPESFVASLAERQGQSIDITTITSLTFTTMASYSPSTHALVERCRQTLTHLSLGPYSWENACKFFLEILKAIMAYHRFGIQGFLELGDIPNLTSLSLFTAPSQIQHVLKWLALGATSSSNTHAATSTSTQGAKLAVKLVLRSTDLPPPIANMVHHNAWTEALQHREEYPTLAAVQIQGNSHILYQTEGGDVQSFPIEPLGEYGPI
ncbi:hypothetical protein FA15DRAFT_696553 [Coprinopsis marcescibilis]|uniref:F-box domain-containing protein n=1 Tax=Coprinopsis marcescibilis TaxID=230819 RepID=A0A5C3KYR8_COPMA|nr:hypothetical protein FA15DRAFT_696553 [Coprinopsis marcescibilis]